MSRASYWGQIVNRTLQSWQDSTNKMLRMSGTDPLQRQARTLYAFRTPTDIGLFATGCDKDMGGNSSVNLTLQSDPDDTGVKANSGQPYARFWGEMRTDVPMNMKGRLRGGYAGMRNKHRPTLFGELMDDFSLHEYIALRVRAGGDPTTRDSYYVNLQTEGPISTDLWQHRLYLRRTDGDWEDIYIPFGSFRLTNSGELVNSDTQMGRDQVRSVGISLLGGNSGVQGKYALDVDSISLVNEVDVGGVGKRSAVQEEEGSKGIDLKDLLPNPPGPVPLPGATQH